MNMILKLLIFETVKLLNSIAISCFSILELCQ